MIIDAHLHVWDRSRARYDWLGPHLPEVDRDVAFEEIAPELARLGVGGVVLVQSADEAGDTQAMLEVADANAAVLGVVGWAPIEAPEVAREALERSAADPRIVGIRTLIHDRDDLDWVLAPGFGEGLSMLEELGLPFDFVTTSPDALGRLDRIAGEHRASTFVLDHLAKPPIGDDARAWESWERALRTTAANENVVAKVSGLYAAVGPWDSWTQSDVDRAVSVAVDAFGPERLLYGGDWPMSTRAGGYERALDAIRAAVDDWPQGHAESLWWRTAARVYRLDVDGPAAGQQTGAA